MHSIQIAPEVLEQYYNKVGQERFELLAAQAKEQLKEIREDKEVYNNYLEQINTAGEVDDIVLWVLFMSNEDICLDYIKRFKKDFHKMVPDSDLADLLFYAVYLKKCKDNELDGIVYLIESNKEEIDDVDQANFMNILCHIQEQKAPKMDFNSF